MDNSNLLEQSGIMSFGIGYEDGHQEWITPDTGVEHYVPSGDFDKFVENADNFIVKQTPCQQVDHQHTRQ